MAGSMKNTSNKMKKVDGKAASQYRNIEDIIRSRKEIYHNTGVSAANAEVYALRGVCEHLFEENQEMRRMMSDMIIRMNKLESQIVRPNTLSQHRTITITETTDVIVDVPSVHADLDNPPYLHPSGRINWNYQNRDAQWSPMYIAFNEFDRYRRDNNIHSMITADDVKRNWSTLYTCVPKLIARNMTLKKLMREYAQERGLNFG